MAAVDQASQVRSEVPAVSMIFPGMDAYLEEPQIWARIHNRFIVYLADQLQPHLRPRYKRYPPTAYKALRPRK